MDEIEMRITDFLKRSFRVGFFEFSSMADKITFVYIEGNRLKGIESVVLSGKVIIDAEDGFLQIRPNCEWRQFVRFTPKALVELYDICNGVVKIASEYEPRIPLLAGESDMLKDCAARPEEVLGYSTKPNGDYFLDDIVLIARTCEKCGKKFHFAVMKDDYLFCREGGDVEDAFHYLTDEEQALYAGGCCCRRNG